MVTESESGPGYSYTKSDQGNEVSYTGSAYQNDDTFKYSENDNSIQDVPGTIYQSFGGIADELSGYT